MSRTIWNTTSLKERIVINCNVILHQIFFDYHQFRTKEYSIRRLSMSIFPPDDSRINGKIKLTGEEVSGGKMNFNVNALLSSKLSEFSEQGLH
jgi:hypothetical protein